MRPKHLGIAAACGLITTSLLCSLSPASATTFFYYGNAFELTPSPDCSSFGCPSELPASVDLNVPLNFNVTSKTSGTFDVYDASYQAGPDAIGFISGSITLDRGNVVGWDFSANGLGMSNFAVSSSWNLGSGSDSYGFNWPYLAYYIGSTNVPGTWSPTFPTNNQGDNDQGDNNNSQGNAPLPAALPLFATGLGALGLVGWRRKRRAQVSA